MQGAWGLLDQFHNIKEAQMQMILFSISWSQENGYLKSTNKIIFSLEKYFKTTTDNIQRT